MERDIKASDIIIRLVLFFLWPFGIIPLALSKRIKHKLCLGFIYFALFCFVGFPMLMYILLPFGTISDGYDFSYGTIVARDMSTQWFEILDTYNGDGIVLLSLIISLPVYIKKIKQDKDLARRPSSSEDVNKKVEGFRAYQQAMRSSDNDKRNTTVYTAKLYGVDYQSNNNQYNPNNAYQKAQVLTEREKKFYETIRPIAEKLDLHLSSKMRLADIVNVSDEIQKQSGLWWSKFEKISKKHIDFALQDKANLEIKLLIEIDDYTHQRADRIERDEFVDSVCKQANIPILHLYDVIGLEDKIVNILHSEETEQEM